MRSKATSVVLAAVISSTGCSDSTILRSGFVDPEVVARTSDSFSSRVGEHLGRPREARYVGNGGRYVLVLDRYGPHLRLFTSDGDHLWTGGTEGGGPNELNAPQAIAVDGDRVLILQRGRISRWVLAEDTLAFTGSSPLPEEYFPLGAVPACGKSDEWLLYARNDAQFMSPVGDRSADGGVSYLHYLKIDGRDPRIRPVWSSPRDLTAFAHSGHNGTLITVLDSSIVMLHRTNYRHAGMIVELDCDAEEVRRHDEIHFVTGDSISVQIPRQSALEWTAGIAATPGGFTFAAQRFFSPAGHDVDFMHYKTELFTVAGGKYMGSEVIPGQWTVMDYHPQAGLLLTMTEPVPHFIRLPLRRQYLEAMSRT